MLVAQVTGMVPSTRSPQGSWTCLSLTAQQWAATERNVLMTGYSATQSPQDNLTLLSDIPCPRCGKSSLAPWKKALGDRALQGLGSLVARAATIAVTGSDLLGNIVAYGPAMDALKGADGVHCSACGITTQLDVRALVQAHREKREAEERRRKAGESRKLPNKDCPVCRSPLRRAQIENMIGNPQYQEWCRLGYCSQKCFATTVIKTMPNQTSATSEPEPGAASSAHKS